MSKEADVIRAAEALQAIRALVEANQSGARVADDVLTLDSIVWRSPRETVPDQAGEVDGDAEATKSTADKQHEFVAGHQDPVPADRLTTATSKKTVDPYAIFDLSDPVMTSRMQNEPTVSAGSAVTQAEILARQAAKELEIQRRAYERTIEKQLAPSPHLQPHDPVAENMDNDAGVSAAFEDFSVNEHEAMMSTPLPMPSSKIAQPTDSSQDDLPEEGPAPSPRPSPRRASAYMHSKRKSAHYGGEPHSEGTHPSKPVYQPNPQEIQPEQATASSARTSQMVSGQIPLHVVADNGVFEGDETNPQDVMRNALRAMIRDQIGHWVEDNIGDLIQDALREPSIERKTTPNRNNRTQD